jgi:hypothetical protein
MVPTSAAAASYGYAQGAYGAAAYGYADPAAYGYAAGAYGVAGAEAYGYDYSAYNAAMAAAGGYGVSKCGLHKEYKYSLFLTQSTHEHLLTYKHKSHPSCSC